jgi:hypothetical protein
MCSVAALTHGRLVGFPFGCVSLNKISLGFCKITLLQRSQAWPLKTIRIFCKAFKENIL